MADIVALVPNMMAAIIPNMAPIAPAHVMCTANVAVIQAAAPIAQIAVKVGAKWPCLSDGHFRMVVVSKWGHF